MRKERQKGKDGREERKTKKFTLFVGLYYFNELYVKIENVMLSEL